MRCTVTAPTLSFTERGVGAVSAIAGSILLIIGTYLHPVPDDPNDAVAAFTAYAADRLWIASHLMQLTGVTLMVVALILLARDLERAGGRAWRRIGTVGAIVSLAVATALQAVDGVALKRMVDAWAAAPVDNRAAAFYAALAVRQIEIGLASMLSLLLGLTAMVYGAALFGDDSYPKWLSIVAIVGGVATAISGVVMAYTGFSGLAMAVNMPASALLILWIVAIGVSMWRHGAS